MQAGAPPAASNRAVPGMADAHQVVFNQNIADSPAAFASQSNPHARSKNISPDGNIDSLVDPVGKFWMFVTLEWFPLATQTGLDGNVIVPTRDIVVFDQDISGAVGIDSVRVFGVHVRSNGGVVNVNIHAEHRVQTPKWGIFERDARNLHVVAAEKLDEVGPSCLQIPAILKGIPPDLSPTINDAGSCNGNVVGICSIQIALVLQVESLVVRGPVIHQGRYAGPVNLSPGQCP
mmetsp:Transcript_12197/g.30858  ORF Transcript_12197/g.30858 Transcript_12197/m.30858 type:complete len:233 (+) Transcript_12197:394-1092(+)